MRLLKMKRNTGGNIRKEKIVSRTQAVSSKKKCQTPGRTTDQFNGINFYFRTLGVSSFDPLAQGIK